jgi:hypothetical protein
MLLVAAGNRVHIPEYEAAEVFASYSIAVMGNAPSAIVKLTVTVVAVADEVRTGVPGGSELIIPKALEDAPVNVLNVGIRQT